MKYDKNDPTLTAYALGELSPEEAKVVQDAIQGDAAIQTEVEALRNLADDLTQTLAAEPLPAGGAIPLDHTELTETTSDASSPSASTETTSDGPGFRRILLLVASIVIVVGVGLILSPGGREYIARLTPEADEADSSATSEQASDPSVSAMEDTAWDECAGEEEGKSSAEPLYVDSRMFSFPAGDRSPASSPSVDAPSASSPERPREQVECEARASGYDMGYGGEGGMGGGYSDQQDGEGEYGGSMSGGEPTPARESLSTDWIDSRGTDGMRYEIGDTEVHDGWAIGDNLTDADPSSPMGGIANPRAPQEEPTPPNLGEVGYMPQITHENPLIGGGTGPEAPNDSGNGLALGTRPESPSAVGMSAPGVLSNDLDIPFQQNSLGLAVPQYGTSDGSGTSPAEGPPQSAGSGPMMNSDAFDLGSPSGLANSSDGRASRGGSSLQLNAEANAPATRSPETMDRQHQFADEDLARTAAANGTLTETHNFPYRSSLYEDIRETDRYDRLPELGLPLVRGEVYFDVEENQFQLPADDEQRFSTFSIDVDTGSYANVRRFVMQQGVVPPPSAVRIEEMVNYFSYDYDPPTDEDEAPFATHVEVGPCPWAPEHRLAKIGIKGLELSANERPPLNLVFLLDVSGSMSSSNKLPLVKQGMTMLAETLRRKDHVAIVTYAGNARTVLPPTSGRDMGTIMDAINQLSSGGSTAGAAGIQQAYDVVQENYDPEAVNRIILCTDGDFNVGVSRFEDLLQIVEDKTDETGAFITILGFGMGNLKEGQLEQLADSGDGNYGYVDNEDEAHKLLVEELSGTLIPIAKNVKIQIDFNPANVQAYRLIGYENRALATEDFYNDAVDAGEIGAGHTVTAIYEIIPPGVEIPTPDVPRVDPSRYDPVEPPVEEPAAEVDEDAEIEDVDGFAPSEFENELFFLKLRYMEVDGDEGIDLSFPVVDPGEDVQMTKDYEFASSVALCGMLLRGSDYAGDGSFATVLELALSGQGDDDRGYRAEFIEIVQRLAPAEATIEAAAEMAPE